MQIFKQTANIDWKLIVLISQFYFNSFFFYSFGFSMYCASLAVCIVFRFPFSILHVCHHLLIFSSLLFYFMFWESFLCLTSIAPWWFCSSALHCVLKNIFHLLSILILQLNSYYLRNPWSLPFLFFLVLHFSLVSPLVLFLFHKGISSGMTISHNYCICMFVTCQKPYTH